MQIDLIAKLNALLSGQSIRQTPTCIRCCPLIVDCCQNEDTTQDN